MAPAAYPRRGGPLGGGPGPGGPGPRHPSPPPPPPPPSWGGWPGGRLGREAAEGSGVPALLERALEGGGEVEVTAGGHRLAAGGAEHDAEARARARRRPLAELALEAPDPVQRPRDAPLRAG